MKKMKIKTIQVSDLGDIVTGDTPPRKNKEFFGIETTWIKPTDIRIGKRFVNHSEEKYSDLAHKKYIKKLIPPNSTCVVTIGSIGKKICMTKEPSFTNQAINSIIPNDEYDPMFVYYVMKYNLHLVESRHSGTSSGRENISKSSFGRIKLNVPVDVDEQKRIGYILSKYDELIESNDKKIKDLDEIIKRLYIEWFLNYKFPGHTKTKFLNSRYGKIPEKWKIKKTKEIFKVKKGSSYKSSNLVEESDIAFITLKSIGRGGGFRYDGVKNFSGDFKEIHKVIPGDIVIAVTDMTQERLIVARPARVPKLKETVSIISMDLVKVNPIIELDKNWLYSFLRYSTFGLEVKEFANGVNVLHLKDEPIEDFEFVMPDKDLTIEFSKIVSEMYDQIDNLYLKNDILVKTREMLSSRFFTKKIFPPTSINFGEKYE